MERETEPMLEHIQLQRIDQSTTDTNHDGDSNCVLDCVKQSRVSIKKLKKVVKSPEADVNFCNHTDRKTALHWAVQRGKVDAVDVLLEAGADIKRDIAGNTALHYAVQSESFPIFKRLLPPLETLEKKFGSEYEYVRNERGLYNARTKIDCYMDMVTSVNTDGFNVLDLALAELTYERRKIVQYIVQDTDLECLLRLLRNNSKRNFSSPFRGLIKEMPEIAKEVMDKCIRCKENEIIFHYELLDDTFFLKYWPPDHDAYSKTREHRKPKDIETRDAYTQNMKKLKNNHPLKLMIEGKRKETTKNGIYQQLLDHPLVKYLVMRKWNHIGLKVHFLNSLWYLIYVLILTVCVSTTVPPYVHSQNTTACQNVTFCQIQTSCQNGNTCKNTTICHDTTTCLNKITKEDLVTCHSFERNHKSIIVDMQYIVITLSSIMLLKEVYKLVKMYGYEYFKQTENYLGLAVYISSVLFVVNVTECEFTDYRTKWQWICGTFSVFVAWMYLLAFAKKFDRLGIYVLMLLSIIITFLWTVFPIVTVLLIATALAFRYIHHDQVNFASILHSIPTTTRMMISGSDYEEFLTSDHDYYSAIPSFIIYAIIKNLLTILVINLMVGVAVEKVKKIHKDARDTNTVLQIEFTLEFEAMICFIISKLRNTCGIEKFRKWFILTPNEEIERTQLKSKKLPEQQIEDLINKNKAENKQDSILKRMNRIEMKMTKILNTVETK